DGLEPEDRLHGGEIRKRNTLAEVSVYETLGTIFFRNSRLRPITRVACAVSLTHSTRWPSLQPGKLPVCCVSIRTPTLARANGCSKRSTRNCVGWPDR